MKFSQSLAITSAFALTAVEVNALGINCRGSGDCSTIVGNINQLISTVGNIQGDRFYNDGEHIACLESELGNGLCVFAQGSGGLPGSSVPPLLQALSDHHCGKCGSVPLFFPQGSNDPSKGILTVNVIGSTGGCNGLC
jgi:hypothetical protein